ncbi:MAG: decaprenylphosphoryl-beta-D-ribose oxidase, partial [Planctomycetia bacterium]|nr:decaprenylphosphoryl-beta-D-ribose oxidase [Planctomycetia bacterium]
LAKDSTLTQEQFEKMYPEVDGFRELRKKVDPRREIQSELSRRLGL